ncbi:MAG: FKBP-type peptidyl-prolyl cis-trans isomerase FklB, partial [Gammaproteobacteria bacterium]|nr:FKBP-type peptidyl-prolyl cis-trans isomerase FklB [Gammaproteobacteria bacterium]
MPMKTFRARNPSHFLVPLAAAILCGSSSARAAQTASPTPPRVAPETGSYDVGLLFGSQLDHSGLVPDLSLETLIRGLRDAVGGRSITAQEREVALRFMRDSRDALVEKNRGAGRQFLESNAKRPGVIAMPSGLQYRVLAPGNPSGKSPAPTDQVTVRYRASLADGTEIDASDLHDRPATFRVNSVFKGWQESLLAMKPGAKWQLFVPAELGYGNNSPPSVPPGALLVYELELLRVDPAAPMDPAAANHHPASGA